MTTVPLAPGYTLRPATLEDKHAILAILDSVALAIVGRTEETIEDVENDLNDPELDLVRDTRLVIHPNGDIIAYAVVYSTGRLARPMADLYLRADQWASDMTTEPALIAWAVERARENLPQIAPELRVAVIAWMHADDERYQQNLRAAGFQPIRYAYEMEIALDEPPTVPPQPAGLTLRVATRDDDWRPIFDARRDAWRDHFGYIPSEYEEEYARWRHYWDEFYADDMWFLLMDGETVAAVCLCEPTHLNDETYGWVTTLAVRRSYRKRGLGGWLLRHAFAVFHGMGRTRVGLGVDGSSLTGAVRLYENAGMRVRTRYDLYELELRPGVETVTQAASAEA